MKNTPNYVLIFNHIVRQIYTGHLAVGENLPSVKSLSKRYAVSENSIKSAVRMLADYGFVETHTGKKTVVVSNSGNLANSSDWISDQMQRISDLYQLFYIIFPPIAVFSINNFKKSDFKELDKIVQGLENAKESPFEFRSYKLLFVDKMVSQSGNSFMKNFCHNVKELVILPHMASDMEKVVESILIPDQIKYCSRAKEICSLAKANQLPEMCRNLKELYRWVQERVLLTMSKILAEYPSTANAPHIPPIYSEYLYDVVVSDIINKIGSAYYKRGDFLPSIQTMMKDCQISLPTARKAYQVLNDYGIAKTINGVGTQVVLFSEYTADYVHTQEGLYRLTRFWEAFQFITVTLPSILPYLAEKIDFDDIKKLEDCLYSHWSVYPEWENYYLVAFLDDLVKSANDDNLSRLISFTKKDMIFGIYIERLYRQYSDNIPNNYLLECFKALNYLKQKEFDLFSKTFSDVFVQLFEYIKNIYMYFGWYFEKVG